MFLCLGCSLLLFCGGCSTNDPTDFGNFVSSLETMKDVYRKRWSFVSYPRVASTNYMDYPGHVYQVLKVIKPKRLKSSECANFCEEISYQNHGPDVDFTAYGMVLNPEHTRLEIYAFNKYPSLLEADYSTYYEITLEEGNAIALAAASVVAEGHIWYRPSTLVALS